MNKPLGTYRILLVGRSYLRHISSAGKDDLSNPNNEMAVIGKRMGLKLNTLATLEDSPLHYEVLDDSRIEKNHFMFGLIISCRTSQKNMISI